MCQGKSDGSYSKDEMPFERNNLNPFIIKQSDGCGTQNAYNRKRTDVNYQRVSKNQKKGSLLNHVQLFILWLLVMHCDLIFQLLLFPPLHQDQVIAGSHWSQNHPARIHKSFVRSHR